MVTRIFFIFATVGKAKIDSTLHHFTAILNFITICVNPFIYGLSNPNYGRRYKKALLSFCPQPRRVGPAMEGQNITDS